MSRRATPQRDRGARTARAVATALLAVILSGAGSVGSADAAVADREPASLRLAIAPFEGDASQPGLADRLAAVFAAGPHARLLAPGSFVAEPGLAPPAEAVRAWAYNAAVDDVLLGGLRIGEDEATAQLVVALRSGHSGAELWREVRTLPCDDDGVPQASDALLIELATSARAALGMTDAEPSGAVDVAAAPGQETEAQKGRSGRGLDAQLDLSGFSSDAPIEINAEEAEIVSRNRGRELVFQRNVEVRQANITLRSDRLEASYRKGESEPDRLVAQGRVFVDQGGRRARCDRAIYVRAAQQLTCQGRAELVQGCDVVRGDAIRFDLADDRARVEGAASIVIRPRRDEAAAGCRDGGDVL